jgi:hypothetical protein
VKKPADGWDAEEQDALRAIQADLEELRSRHAADPQIELLRAARAGVLPEAEQADVQALLDRSEWHRALAAGADAVDEPLSTEDRSRLLRRIQKAGDSGRPVRPRAFYWQPALAATIVVVAAGAWFAWRRAEPVATPAPDARVAAAPPPAASYVLALDPPLLKVSPASLTYRGTGGGTDVLTDLKPAFDALRAGDYAKAARDLAPLASSYPASVEIPYYQGIAHLFLNDPAAALDSFARAERLADVSFAADVTWYQAVANERAGRREAARARLSLLCAQKGPRSAEACAAAPSLR